MARKRRTAGMQFLNKSVSRDITTISNTVRLTDCQPDGPDEQCLSSELSSCEQRTVVLSFKRLHVFFYDFLRCHPLRFSFFAGHISKPSIDCLEHLKCQGFWFTILLGNVIDGVDRILVSSLGEEISGGFGQFENKNAHKGKCEG